MFGSPTPLMPPLSAAPFSFGFVGGLVLTMAVAALVTWLLLRRSDLLRAEWRARKGLGFRGRWEVARSLNTGNAVRDPRYARAGALSAQSYRRIWGGRIGLTFKIVSVVTGLSQLACGVLFLVTGPELGSLGVLFFGNAVLFCALPALMGKWRLRRFERAMERNQALVESAGKSVSVDPPQDPPPARDRNDS